MTSETAQPTPSPAGVRASAVRPVLLLDAQTSPTALYEHPAVRDRVEVVDLYELPEVDLDPYAAVYLSGFVDQELLWRHREVVAAFLDRGRVVVFAGHLLHPWLPGCGTFVPAPVSSFRDYAVHLVGDHPVFEGVDARDLTFRRGVAGFFARGHHPPPPGAEVLATLAGGQPVTWVDRTVTNGTVLAHAGNDLLGFADDTTAARVGPQLLDWAAAEGMRR